MALAMAERILWYASLALTLLLLIKLYRTRLHKPYRFLTVYLAWQVIGSVVLFALPRPSRIYGRAYFGLTAVEWIIYVLVILELVSHVSRQYPGIASLARKVVNIALPVSALIALATAAIDLGGNRPSRSPVLDVFQLIDRTISIDVLSFLALILVFLMWFPVSLTRNTVAYTGGFMIIFASKACILLLGNALGFARYTALNFGLMGLVLGVLLYWLITMNPSNERLKIVVRQAWTRAGENRLMEQLESINESLLRTTTKERNR